MILSDTDPMLDFVKLIGGAGGIGVMAMVTWLWLNGKIITKSGYDKAEERTEQMRKERDEWKATALRLLESTERLQSTADRAVGTAASAVGAIRNNGGSK